MKKIMLFLMGVILFCFSNLIFASHSVSNINLQPNWTGFYVGANGGYWGSVTDKISITGSANYANPTFEWGSNNIANALAQLANNNASLNSVGFIGGGQIGYDYEFKKNVLIGLNIHFDSATNSNNSFTVQQNVNLVDFNENYSNSLTVKQKINYLSAIRARLGYLFDPTFLVYATGGVAYVNVNLDTSWTAQESLGSTVFPTIVTQNNISKTLTGWTAGGGIEWLFHPHWSAMIEYDYYSLNNLNGTATLQQFNGSFSPPVLWGSALAKTTLSFSTNTIRLGINYHF